MLFCDSMQGVPMLWTLRPFSFSTIMNNALMSSVLYIFILSRTDIFRKKLVIVKYTAALFKVLDTNCHTSM